MSNLDNTHKITENVIISMYYILVWLNNHNIKGKTN